MNYSLFSIILVFGILVEVQAQSLEVRKEVKEFKDESGVGKSVRTNFYRGEHRILVRAETDFDGDGDFDVMEAFYVDGHHIFVHSLRGPSFYSYKDYSVSFIRADEKTPHDSVLIMKGEVFHDLFEKKDQGMFIPVDAGRYKQAAQAMEFGATFMKPLMDTIKEKAKKD
jgi:hypothetical protein